MVEITSPFFFWLPGFVALMLGGGTLVCIMVLDLWKEFDNSPGLLFLCQLLIVIAVFCATWQVLILIIYHFMTTVGFARP